MSKKVYVSQELQDKKATLNGDLKKVKAIYAPFTEWEEATAEREEATAELTPLSFIEDTELYLGLFQAGNGNIVAVAQEYTQSEDDNIVLVTIAEVARGEKVYLFPALFGFVESLLVIKNIDGLSLNGWNEIEGGMLEYRAIQPRKSLKERMMKKGGK